MQPDACVFGVDQIWICIGSYIRQTIQSRKSILMNQRYQGSIVGFNVEPSRFNQVFSGIYNNFVHTG